MLKARRSSEKALLTFAWGALVYTVLVILWGAVVRIAGAGAGCGDHWPLCNGAVVPPTPTVQTLIEFSHRLTSGLSGFVALVLVVWVFRARPKGDPARLGAAASLVLLVFEGLVGGLQVRLGWTADSTHPGRGFIQGVHLANTFSLIAAFALTIHWLRGAPLVRLRGQGWWSVGVVSTLVGVLALGMAGAVTALGDLLYRPTGSTPLDTLRSDFSATATFFEQLRVVHPVLGVLVCAGLFVLARTAMARRPSADVARWSAAVTALIISQGFVGFLNVALKAPNWLQLSHLLFACLLWLATVLLGYNVLAASSRSSAPSRASKEVTA
ncbi:COX15/CtaA family protein [Deinococcus yavapaiensis]|uniref:Cytochrome c oxidase assembly protein subunit 15 n=1 Tax=Deinococcus yavapaiensis KR-236 TaxID=694435 RepID=A0A318S901_9DEIO|nr:COX15/CtaA family protein [Deinococcus yavapaiensis]PYE52906.1 cytochrome c oxidase assembly protein subunit 15 [Deinococcus yavapaiensis KR-236]